MNSIYGDFKPKLVADQNPKKKLKFHKLAA